MALEPHESVEMYQADDRLLQFTIVGLADVTSVDDAQWDLYYRHTSYQVLVKTLGSGIALNSSTNTVDVTLDEADTELLEPAVYDGELRLRYTSGYSEIAAVGTITIKDRRVGE